MESEPKIKDLDFEPRIRELRKKLNLSQAALAAKVGVRRETIIHLENKRYVPSLKLSYAIASAFGLKIEEVFVFGGNKPELT